MGGCIHNSLKFIMGAVKEYAPTCRKPQIVHGARLLGIAGVVYLEDIKVIINKSCFNFALMFVVLFPFLSAHAVPAAPYRRRSGSQSPCSSMVKMSSVVVGRRPRSL